MTFKITDIGDTVRQDILFRMRWNILTDLNHIAIATGTENEDIIPFLDSHTADESLASPPLSSVRVYLGDCLDKEFHRWDGGYEAPPPLIIHNADGRAITLKDFVTQVHAYMTYHIADIKRTKGDLYGETTVNENGNLVNTITCGRPYLPPNIGLFFKRVWAMAREDHIRISVMLYAEGEMFTPLEKFWAQQMKQARWLEEPRKQPEEIILLGPLPAGTQPPPPPDGRHLD